MTVPTASAFLTRFPEFNEQSLSVVEEVIAEAGRSTPVETWGSVHTEAVSYLAAHILAVRVMQIGLQVGTLSGSAQGDMLNSTLYGQEFMRLFNNRPLSGFAL